MKNAFQTFTQKISATRVVSGFMAMAFVAVVGVSGVASATPGYFNVEKGPKGPGHQQVCYTQTGIGWQEAGFRDLDHCLRYIATGAPEDQDVCKGGWWYVYGFNSLRQCKEWVVYQGNGGYDGSL